MKVKGIVLVIAISSIAIAKVSAENPTGDNPQPVSTKSHVEVEEPSSILTTFDGNPVLKAQESQFFESAADETEYINLHFKTDSFSDTTNYDGLKIYIKGIKPVIKKMSLEDIERIEIL